MPRSPQGRPSWRPRFLSGIGIRVSGRKHYVSMDPVYGAGASGLPVHAALGCGRAGDGSDRSRGRIDFPGWSGYGEPARDGAGPRGRGLPETDTAPGRTEGSEQPSENRVAKLMFSAEELELSLDLKNRLPCPGGGTERVNHRRKMICPLFKNRSQIIESLFIDFDLACPYNSLGSRGEAPAAPQAAQRL